MRISTPNFLQLPIYAFELSDKSYKYLRLAATEKGVIVSDFGEGDIADGVIERGEIKKKDVLAALLKDLFIKNNIKFVALSLPEEKGFLKNIQLSGVTEEEIGQALELQLEEHIPLPPSEVVFDYTIVKKERGHFDLVLNAFPRQLVESYLDAFASAGALPAFVESELAASIRSLAPKDFTGAAMIIDWGKTRISLFIVEEGALRFASTIPVGGETLDQAIAKSLNVDIAKAEELKRKHGFLKNDAALPIAQAMMPMATTVREEAEKQISFWQSHSENKKLPERIFLAGGNANLPGLAGYFQQTLHIITLPANSWANVPFPKHYLPPIEQRESIRFTASVGLALATLNNEKTL